MPYQERGVIYSALKEWGLANPKVVIFNAAWFTECANNFWNLAELVVQWREDRKGTFIFVLFQPIIMKLQVNANLWYWQILLECLTTLHYCCEVKHIYNKMFVDGRWQDGQAWAESRTTGTVMSPWSKHLVVSNTVTYVFFFILMFTPMCTTIPYIFPWLWRTPGTSMTTFKTLWPTMRLSTCTIFKFLPVPYIWLAVLSTTTRMDLLWWTWWHR